MPLLIIMVISALFSFIFGLFIKKGKGHMLIAGYNTMPAEEREKIDKRVLSKVIGNLMFRIAIELALLGLVIYFEMSWAIVVLIIIIIADPIITSLRMRVVFPGVKGVKRGKGKSKLSIIITIATLIAIGIMFYYGEKEATVNITNDKIKISGMYGLEIDFSQVSEISLIEKSMKDIGTGRRTNGYGGLGSTLKGHFSSESLGKTMLFVDRDSPYTIWIKRNNLEDIYISYSNKDKTKTLFNKLSEKIY